MRESLLAQLRHHPFVAEFEPRHVEKLATLGREIRFDRDHIIFREGDESSEFYLIVTGLVSLEITAPGHTFRVQTLFAGDELGWSAVLMGRGKHFQARTLERVDALAFEGAELLAACKEDTAFGFAFMLRLLNVVAGRLQATRLQVLDMYSPVAARAGA
jgi:CRP/FNR family transcriptional regulator, cyclic AMP receptor protein